MSHEHSTVTGRESHRWLSRCRFYKNFSQSKKKCFSKYVKKYADGKKEIEEQLKTIKKHCSVVRVIAHTTPAILPLSQKKPHVMEIQINGGTPAQKVDFAVSNFEKAIPIDAVFNVNDMIDTIAITKGHGTQGVISRWGVTRLPRKTHRGLRKVACIGSWHPARVKWTVARAGQTGFHHRTEINKKIYKIGIKGHASHSATTEFDVTTKDITPMGGFAHYGVVNQSYLMIKVRVRERDVSLVLCLALTVGERGEGGGR